MSNIETKAPTISRQQSAGLFFIAVAAILTAAAGGMAGYAIAEGTSTTQIIVGLAASVLGVVTVLIGARANI